MESIPIILIWKIFKKKKKIIEISINWYCIFFSVYQNVALIFIKEISKFWNCIMNVIKTTWRHLVKTVFYFRLQKLSRFIEFRGTTSFFVNSFFTFTIRCMITKALWQCHSESNNRRKAFIVALIRRSNTTHSLG